MFCYQCEQSSQRTGCTSIGVCGKNPETAALQDLLLHALKGISVFAHRAALAGKRSPELEQFALDALFTTVTNVNFDPVRIQGLLNRAGQYLDTAKKLYESIRQPGDPAVNSFNGATCFRPAPALDDLIRQGEEIGVESRLEKLGPDILGLQELLTYGLKGMAAYAWHAVDAGEKSEGTSLFIFEALAAIAPGQTCSIDKLLGLCQRCGEANYQVLESLDSAHTRRFGHPVPTQVLLDPLPGHCILVSGHNLEDLEALLEQTKDSGINIYTHGEMLPAHGYPALKKYPHLAGHYGGAWQDQARDFDRFPGAILMTTNCIQLPKQSYFQRIFTCGLVAWPGVRHIEGRNFSAVIKAAKRSPGFTAAGEGKTLTLGFGHNAVLGVADQVIDAVKSGAIKHFFLVGGCDGAKTGRNYYTEFTEKIPDDCVILTLGCGKFRFNRHDFGSIDGIPRLLDCGQCNDAYSAIKIATALAEAFNCGINDLPLSLNISWYEQKAVAVLLTLLHLGVRNIRLGPTLPAFATPAIVSVLAEKFNLMAITDAESDLAACLA
ncbi:hydroxylamine reductase [Oscillatoria laete-virens NRMC-F 0139]|nr:hydroxylamine reductase [Oscillatoria laete-virens NRMC-F 0139]